MLFKIYSFLNPHGLGLTLAMGKTISMFYMITLPSQGNNKPPSDIPA